MFTNRNDFPKGRAIGLATVVLVTLANAVFAQESDNVTVERLREELAARDAVIVELLNRVKALEETLAVEGSSPPTEFTQHDGPSSLAVADTRQGSGPTGDGEDEIDELLAERALERGLVQEGARLLRPGQIELAPGFAVARDEGMFPTALMVGDDSLVGEVERTFEIYDVSTQLRFGLPHDFQLDVGLPYRVVSQQIQTGIDGAVQTAGDQSGSGLGDISIGIAKALTAEESWRPSIIGQLVWLTGSGEARDDNVYLGGGNPGLSARLSASWRRDPVVFLMSGGYTYFEEDDMIRLGDGFDFSLGLGLAVSPETALIFSLEQGSASELERAGVELPGTDRLASTFNLSASTILGRRLFLRADAGVGLTRDAPDFRLDLTFSSRLDRR
jgi:hypothetical protein